MDKLLNTFAPLLLLLVFSLLFFTGLGKPVVIDYDEGVYAEVSRAMYRDGELVVPQLNGLDFFEKPPLLYWLQILGYTLFGVNAFGARVFNAFCAIVSVTALYFAARKPLGPRVAFNTSLIMGSSIIFIYLARVAMTDMALTMFFILCLVTSQHGVEQALHGKEGVRWFWLGCLCAGLAMLTKGAIGALFPVVTAIMYLLRIGRISLLFRKNWLLPGTLILMLVGFSWYLLLGVMHPDGFSFMKELFIRHHIGRFSSAMEGHSGPIYYYLIVLLFGFMPWFSYLPIALVELPLSSAHHPGVRFTIVFVIFSLIVFLFFSVAATKLPNYILPVLPGFALALALLFNKEHIRYPTAWRYAALLSATLPVLLGLVLIATPLIFPYLGEILGENSRKTPVLAEPVTFGHGIWLAASLFFISGFLIFRLRNQKNLTAVFETLLLCSFIHALALFFIVIPIYDRLFDAPLARLATQAAELTPTEGKILLYGVDDRPSINFVSGRKTLKVRSRNPDDLDRLFRDKDVRVGITTVYYFEHLLLRHIPVSEISRDHGFILFHPGNNEPNGDE